jgi:protocatechuate 3,4-dioxygenase beta subunit
MTSVRRRRLVTAALFLPVSSSYGQVRSQSCASGTPAQTEGPFFKPDTPERLSFVERGSNAQRLVIAGRVLSRRDCVPIAGALLEFWHSDERGEYDNSGYRYRGHQRSDREGRYRLETILPALYPGRTRHVHVKVQGSGGRGLTTQLYFPNEPANRRDGRYEPRLEMKMTDAGTGTFDFIVDV